METKKLKDLSFEALCGIIAKVIHSSNRAYVDAIGGRAVNLTWEEIREEERQGLIKAISSMIINPQTPQVSHEQWCLAREKDGWTKDLKYDYHRKTHPNMVPYDQLPAEEQFKDHLFMGIASIFCGGWGILDMPDVKAARTLIEAQFEEASEKTKLKVEDEIDPVDTEETAALQAKLKLAEEMLDKLEAEQNAKDEEGEDHPKGKLKDEEKPNLPDEPKKPLPSADEILANKPAEFTAKDLAEDVLGANNVGIADGVGSGEIKETPDVVEPTKPKPKAKPKKKATAKK